MLTTTEKFVREIARIQNREVFLGVARILKVKVFDAETKEPRQVEDILCEVIDNFDGEKRKRQKELLRILKEANKCKEDLNGNSTEDTAEAELDKEM